jgi:hypothetical protein
MFNPRIVQDGGAYISTIDASIVNVSSQALSGLNLSTLEYLMKLGNIPTADLLLTASLPQISAFIRTVEGNITADNNTIQLNTISISHFISTIHKPGGLQDTYNTLSTNYTSSINAYVNQSNLIYMQNQNYANDTSTLRTQYEISTLHASTLLSYTQQYSYAMSSLSTQEITIKHLEKIYQTNILNMSTSIFLYNATQREMQNISTVIAGDVASLKTPGLTQEVIKAYSTSYLQNTALYSTLTNVLNNYNFSTQYFNQERMNTFAYLSTVYKVTQFNTIGMEQYTDTITYYQQQQTNANGTVTALSYELSTIKISIASLENEINVVIPGQFQSDVHTILSTGKQYYTYLDNDIDLLCNEYIGGLQTYNSKIGYTLGSLGVAINTNVKEINRSILTVNAGGAAVLTAQQIQMFADDNIEMNKIISTLNTFDTNFTEIIGNITDERALLHSFVQTRQNTFINYDVPAISLTGPTNAAAAYTYVSSFIKMNQILNTVNTMITKRLEDVSAITAKITPLKSDINRYFRKYLGAQMTDDQIPAAIMNMNDVNGNPLGPIPIGLEEYMIPQSQFYDYIPTNPLFLFSPLTGIQGGVPTVWLNPSDTFTINGNVISNRVGNGSALLSGVSVININNAILSGAATSGNTLSALKFTAGSSLVSNANVTLSATVTIFVVGSISASAAPFAKVFSFTGANKFHPVLQYKANLLQNSVTSYVGNKYGNLTSTYGNNLAMFESVYANGLNTFILNGNPTPNTSVPTPALGSTGYTIGGTGNTAFDGVICEVLVYNSLLSVADTAIIEGYLAWKWGLVDSLPLTHPHKTAFNYSKLVQYPVIPIVLTPSYTIPTTSFCGFNAIKYANANGDLLNAFREAANKTPDGITGRPISDNYPITFNETWSFANHYNDHGRHPPENRSACDNSPVTIPVFTGGNPIIWLDPSDTSTLSGYIIIDKSGNGNNAVNRNNTTDFTIRQITVNGLKAIEVPLGLFLRGRTNQALITANGSGVNLASVPALTIFIVVLITSEQLTANSTNNAKLISIWDNSNADYSSNVTSIIPLSFNNNMLFASKMGDSERIQITEQDLNRPSIFYSMYDSGVTRVGINGKLSNSKTLNTTPLSVKRFTIGGRTQQNGTVVDNFQGTICEVLIFPYAMTDAQRQFVEIYLASKWGILSSLNQYGTPTL